MEVLAQPPVAGMPKVTDVARPHRAQFIERGGRVIETLGPRRGCVGDG